MKSYNILIICCILTFVLIGCFRSEEPVQEVTSINSLTLRELVRQASESNRESNDKLSGIFDESFPINKNYNKLLTDSIQIIDGKTLFYVMLEYSNPLYNRFAVYDKYLNLYLMDKSLNGDFAFEIVTQDSQKYARIVESFLSRDIINLKRLSLYKIDTSSVSLAFRSYISMMTPELFLSQEIDSTSSNMLRTYLMLPRQFDGTPTSDTFYYDKSKKMFLSKSNRFDGIVKQLVNSLQITPSLPEIRDAKSARRLFNSRQ